MPCLRRRRGGLSWQNDWGLPRWSALDVSVGWRRCFSSQLSRPSSWLPAIRSCTLTSSCAEALMSAATFESLSGDGILSSCLQADRPNGAGAGRWRVDRRDGAVVQLPDGVAVRISRDGSRVLVTERKRDRVVVRWASCSRRLRGRSFGGSHVRCVPGSRWVHQSVADGDRSRSLRWRRTFRVLQVRAAWRRRASLTTVVWSSTGCAASSRSSVSSTWTPDSSWTDQISTSNGGLNDITDPSSSRPTAAPSSTCTRFSTGTSTRLPVQGRRRVVGGARGTAYRCSPAAVHQHNTGVDQSGVHLR